MYVCVCVRVLVVFYDSLIEQVLFRTICFLFLRFLIMLFNYGTCYRQNVCKEKTYSVYILESTF